MAPVSVGTGHASQELLDWENLISPGMNHYYFFLPSTNNSRVVFEQNGIYLVLLLKG